MVQVWFAGAHSGKLIFFDVVKKEMLITHSLKMLEVDR
jgi:hypothetical protein